MLLCIINSRTLSGEEDSIVLDYSHAQLPLQQSHSQENKDIHEKEKESTKTSNMVSPILPRRRKRGHKRKVQDEKAIGKANESCFKDDGSLASLSSSDSSSCVLPPENTTVPLVCEKNAALNETPPLFWNLGAPSSPPLYHS